MYRQILGKRALWTLGLAESVSGVGNWITMLAVFSLLVFRGTGGVAQSSAVFLAGLVPTLLASPFAGWLCDRFDRKRLMIGSELVSGLVVTGLVFTDRLELIYALLVAQAISMSIMTPARQAVLPSVVSSEELPRANAFLSQLAGMVKIGAPVFAGLVLSVVDPHTAILLDAISFGFAALILGRLPALPPQGQPGGTVAGRGRSAHPAPERTLLTVLGESAPLRLLFVSSFVAVVVLIGFDALAAVFIRDVLRGNEELFGLLIGVIGLGTVGAATVVLWRKSDRDPWRDLSLGLLLLAAIPASMALVAHLHGAASQRVMAVAGCLLGGLGSGLVNVQTGTLLQTLSPGPLLGRLAGALQSTLVAGQLVGLLLTPLLVPTLLPMAIYFVVATLVLTLLVLAIVLCLRRSQRPSPAQPSVQAGGATVWGK